MLNIGRVAKPMGKINGDTSKAWSKQSKFKCIKEFGFMKIFISHSSKDKFVKSFVDFLTSLGINPNDIFCSSLEGQGVKKWDSNQWFCKKRI